MFLREEFQRLNARLAEYPRSRGTLTRLSFCESMSRILGSLWRLCACLTVTEAGALAAQGWAEALAAMPLISQTPELNRTNCVGLMLRSFRSNQVVKALVFMPGATDELYMFRRVHVQLTDTSPSLLHALNALTNQSLIRADFCPPFLLLHTAEDPVTLDLSVLDTSAVTRFRRRTAPHLLFDDRDWDAVQPVLKKATKADIRPWLHSRDSWHFYRHSYVGWNLDGWEALQVTALAGKSKFTLKGRKIIFEPDTRVLAVPKADPALLLGH